MVARNSSHRLKKNEGEAPKYYVEGNHDAIIDPKVFELVQAEMDKRKKSTRRYSGVSIFSSKIICGDCGEFYGSKVWHSTDRYRKVIYRCNHKYGNECQTPHVTEDEIREGFVRAYNKLIPEKDEIIENIREMKDILCDTDELFEEKKRLDAEVSIAAERLQEAIDENARIAQDQKEYAIRYAELDAKYEKLSAERDEIADAIKEREAKAIRLDEFIRTLAIRDGVLAEFDESLWGCLVESVTIGRQKDMTFRFRGGSEISV